MKKLILLLSINSLFTCNRDNLSEVLGTEDNGVVKLSVKLDQSFEGGNGEDSPWNHTYQSEATVTFTSTTSVFTKSVTFDPNDLANFPATSLPYGDYNWSVAQTGEDVAVSSVLYVYGSSSSPFTVDAPTVSMPLVLDTDFALVTVAAADLSSASIRQNGVNTSLTVQDGYYFGYINSNFTGFTLNIVTTELFGGADTIASPVAKTHYNYAINYQEFADTGVTLELSSTFVLENRGITAGLDEDLDGVLDTDDLCPGTRSGAPVDANGCLDVIELDANGVTIKAKPGAAAGDQQDLNGVTYTVVDETMLRSMVANDEDVTAVVTSLVTNMNNLFNGKRTFNQNIRNWDVSNVTNMEWMFLDTSINQDLNEWDMRKVENTSGMFANAMDFNGNISDWDVSNISDMNYMFNNSSFNGTIGNWDVRNVTNMAFMFRMTPFNQSISSWDVSNVLNMELMFEQSAFNQDISNWDVSKVTTMNQMFQASPFNQDIGNWSVGNVSDMNGMFNSSNFNQDISSWDVGKVTNMYNMFANMAFNQDLSSWNVAAVTQCTNFSVNNTSWILPKPNFTNCTP